MWILNCHSFRVGTHTAAVYSAVTLTMGYRFSKPERRDRMGHKATSKRDDHFTVFLLITFSLSDSLRWFP